jgi:enterochelin esterase-like enzyme
MALHGPKNSRTTARGSGEPFTGRFWKRRVRGHLPSLTSKGYTVSYQECNDGHEYLCWRGAFADGLLYLAQ